MNKDFTVSEMRTFIKSRIDNIKANPTEVAEVHAKSGKSIILNSTFTPDIIHLTMTLGTLESLVEEMEVALRQKVSSTPT
jgi:hypothetical protein